MASRRTTSEQLIDRHVGARMRHGRVLLGLSQTKLASDLGITFQQVQKYESGANRIGASRLWQIAKRLGLSPGWFFQDMPDSVAAATRVDPLVKGRAPAADGGSELFRTRETLEYVRALQRVSDPRVRRLLYDLAMTLGADPNDQRGAAPAAE